MDLNETLRLRLSFETWQFHARRASRGSFQFWFQWQVFAQRPDGRPRKPRTAHL